MDRSEFLAKFGLGMAAVCAGCGLAACGSKGSNPSPVVGGAPPPPPVGSGNLFTLNLTNELTNVGQSTTQNGVIVVRIAGGNTPTAFTAVQVACTHEGTTIGYNTGQKIFICPAHGSEFSNSGAVLVGPAALPLHQYNVSVDGDTLTVSA